ncbi:MAG: ABC transporter ATP-binding protein [Alphaproteobacteria bacterium]|nr:ABC transporter ATP-binding protein [Alphaproteobacteria bacterium]
MTGASPLLIDVGELTVRYGRHDALSRISLALPPGRITALVGPNGAGKTTLMRCLARLIAPDEGRVMVCGLDAIANPRAVQQRVGYVPDDFGLHRGLTVRQLLHHQALAQGLAPRVTIPDIAALLGVSQHLDDRASSLSRGWSQRVAIALAILHRPPLVILDEPASGLDPDARDELARLLKRLNAEGMSLLVSSHILAELEAYCTDMVILEDGRLVAQVDAPTHAVPEVIRVAVADQAPLAPRLSALGVVVVRDEGRQVLIEAAGAATERATLLRQLVEAGLPVCHFEPVTERLADVYRRSIASGASAAPSLPTVRHVG